MELASELEASLREFAAAGPVELRENGSRVSLAGLSWEVRGTGAKPLVHLWSEQYNLTRRVLAITDHSDRRLALAVERFGRSKPGRLEFIRTDFERAPRDVSRAEFCEILKRILASQFPDELLESVTISPDLEHSLSGNYARGVLRRGSALVAFLAVPGSEPAENVGRSLTFALLWLDRARGTRRGNVTALRLIVPKGTSGAVAHLCAALRPECSPQIYELDSVLETLTAVDPRAASNVRTSLVLPRESEALLERARPAVDPVVALAPRALTVHAAPQTREVLLRFRGLPVLRWHDGHLFFATPDCHDEVSSASDKRLSALLRKLELCRNPLASDTRHPLFRAQPERWLEALAGGEHGILDLLTVTQSGRLAILELKASEHIHLPLQAADYWLRIRRHLEQRDLSRYGYFSGVELQASPPLVYLVAPALHFHPSADTLLRCLVPEMEVVRVGLAESWRSDLRVVLRH
jgi:hypothetical protein